MRNALFLILSVISIYSMAQKRVVGIVLDADENPIVNVRVEENGTRNATYTRSNGEFTLIFFDRDNTLTFTQQDYKTVKIKMGEKSKLKVFMTTKVNGNEYDLGNQAGYLDFGLKNKGKRLHNMPYFLGESDVNRQLQMLPGIEQGREGYSNLLVRGGDVDQNLIMYNGSPVYNSNHIFGISSIFHHRSIANSSVHRGMAPAKYGGRTSSFINFQSAKTSEYSGLEGEFELTPLNAGIYFQNIKKDDFFFTLSARRSWVDLLIPEESRQNSLNANIYDLQLNFGKVLKNKDQIKFSFLNTRDLFFIGFGQTDTVNGTAASSRLGITEKWSNIVTSAVYNQDLSSKLKAEHRIHYSDYRSSFLLTRQSRQFNDFGRLQILSDERNTKRGISDLGIHSDWEYHLTNKHLFSFGLQSSTKFFQTGKIEVTSEGYGSDNEDIILGNDKYQRSQELAAYGGAEYRHNDNLLIDYGLRIVNYSYDGFTDFVAEPRIHTTFFLPNRDALKLGYNRHNQFLNQLNLGQTGGPNNVWVPATANVAPQFVNMLEASYERKLGTMYSASINMYFKQMQNVIQVTDLNDATDPERDWQGSVASGNGRAYGAELFLQKSKGQFTGWLSYVYSRSFRTFESVSEEEFLFTFDRPHMLKMYGNIETKFSDWNIGFNLVVGSGQLFTIPIGKFIDQNGVLQLEYNTLNNFRSDIYHRVDISLTRKKDPYGLAQEWRFYMYNALGARNPLNINPNFADGSLREVQINRNYLAYVPGVAYIVKF